MWNTVFSGFFRKEIILQRSSLINNSSILFSILFVLRIILTQIYRIRFIYKVFFISKNFLSYKNFSEIDFNSFYSIIILFLPACLTGRFLRRMLKINFDFFSDLRFLKTIICLLFLIRVILRLWILKKNISKLTFMFIFNIWLLSYFSGSYFSKLCFYRDKNYKTFLNNLRELMLVYRLKLIRISSYIWIRFLKDKIIKFSIIIGILIIILFLYHLVYVMVYLSFIHTTSLYILMRT